MSYGDEFTVRVDRATLLPDEAALRELVEQLRQELADDPELKKAFGEDPRTVLGDRGVALDLRRELLVASGLGGGSPGTDCVFTCVITDIVCTSTICVQ
jgi:hypothetical protein